MTTQPPTLTNFLLARIAEDEMDALDHYSAHEDGANVDGAPCVMCGTPYPCRTRRRVLAECEAKRRIVGQIDRNVRDAPAGWTEHLLRLLAQPYADHPDFREEWRP